MKVKIYNLFRYLGNSKKTNTLSKNLANSRTVFLILMMLFLKIDFLKAQTFPLSGATWIFKSNNPTWINVLAQKWEYKSDSITADGTIKKMKVTTKTVNPAWYPNDTTIVTEVEQNFLFVGDTIWDMRDSLSPLANFSLQVGDSAFTPYHSQLSPLYPSVTDSITSCSEEVQSLFFQKGIVIDAGTETEDNISYRYYYLKFLGELEGDTIIRKFSERTILTEDYWHYNNQFLGGCGLTDIPGFSFQCFKDDFSENLNCNDIEWFESLSTIDKRQLINFEIYPNPANENVSIRINDLGIDGDLFTLRVYDIIGKLKIKKEVYFIGGNETKLNLSELGTGIYFIEISSKDVKFTSKLIKK